MSLTAKTKNWLKRNADISLAGKTVVVTGANSGVGFKTAESMLYLGADVILACRNQQRAENARAALAADYPSSRVSVMSLDLADLSSIDTFVGSIVRKGIDIDVFVNNAGVFHQPGMKTKQGFDLVIGTNYFGVYYLTEKLMPYLLTLPHEVTYINTVSLVYKFAGRIDYGDFYCYKRRITLPVYFRSKICLAKYTYYKAMELAGSNVRVLMNHPGIAITPLGLHAIKPRIAKLEKYARPLFNSPEKSSLSVACILAHGHTAGSNGDSDGFPAGSLIGPGGLIGGWGYPTLNHLSRKARTGAPELIAFTRKELGLP